MFQKTPLGWIEAATLTASDGTGGSFFGMSVAISAGEALVGAPFAGAPFAGKGAVYVYGAGLGFAWSELAKLEASDAMLGGQFGRVLAADATRLFVSGTNGAPAWKRSQSRVSGRSTDGASQRSRPTIQAPRIKPMAG